MDPSLKRCSRGSSNCLTTHNPDRSSELLCSVSSNRNSVLTNNPTIKPRKSSTSLQNLFQCKSMSQSADFESSGRLQAQSKGQTTNFSRDLKVEKELRPGSKFKSGKEKVKVKALPHEEEKKEVYCKLKGCNNEGIDVSIVAGNEMKRLSLGGDSVTVGIGRRRSLLVAQTELRDFLANNGAKVVAVDMPPFMQIHAVDCARRTNDSLEKFSSKALALTLKKEFDGAYGPAWHCIVGTSFGSFVTHSVGGFLYFTMDQKLYILLFKTTVQRA